MKFIQKGGAPHSYRIWCKKVAGTAKEDYQELPKLEKAELLLSLVMEQGWICAYTMKRIDEATSHVEHIKPESLCREDKTGSDLDYDNLVAGFPREGMLANYRYGAQKKDNWWVDDGRHFISPLHPNCEKRFQFDLAGNIKAVNNNAAAAITINVLGLKHDTITEERRRVIEEFVYGSTGDAPLSPAQAAREFERICERDHDGRFYEFCVAIRDALGQHVYNLQKLAAKRRFARMKKTR
jgi:uncharacterized protein (TIGR02646 family)